MIAILSPAKSLNFKTHPYSNSTIPRFSEQPIELIKVLKKKKTGEIRKLMDVSEKIAILNVERYKNFGKENQTKQAILAFDGDVYTGMKAGEWSDEDFQYAQTHLRIISGLYGLLRPLDLIQPYRLEMGTKLQTKKGKNLYEFWGNQITEVLKQDLKSQGDDIIINLASQEYTQALQMDNFYQIQFKEYRNDQLMFVSYNAKRARGMMTSYMIKNKINNPQDLKYFSDGGYVFEENLSSETNFVFTR
ncbi:MAG: hypothetical protein RJA52_626 [Bacteroidota bacterium]|jgi:cytoplasmic iron level regulating protein YaaA (DUF328/UPF0246 family)